MNKMNEWDSEPAETHCRGMELTFLGFDVEFICQYTAEDKLDVLKMFSEVLGED